MEDNCYFCGGVVLSRVYSSSMFCSEACTRAAREIAQLEDRIERLLLELSALRG